MLKHLLVAFSFSAFFLWSFAQPVNINLSNTFVFAGEPYIAINPTNPQNIVVAWMAADLSTGLRVSIKSKVSFNGGSSWGSQFIQPHFSPNFKSADVSLAFKNNGTLYLAYVDYREGPDSGVVVVTHSVNGGVNWSAPTVALNIATDDPSKRPLDRPWLTIDNSNATSQGTLYITTKPAPWILPPNRPYFKSSTDSGLTWSNLRYVDTVNYLTGNNIASPLAYPAVAADGSVCIVYPSYLVSQSIFSKFLFAKSINRGASFIYNDLLVNFPTVNGNSDYKLGYRLLASPADANKLAFLFVGNLYGDPDIFITVTNNGGATWNTPIRVNDDAIGNGKAQDLCWASYNKSGILLVSWRDRRNATDTGFKQPCDTYCSISRNDGTSFQTNLRLSDATVAFDSVLANSGNDFMGCQLVNDSIYATWSDVRNGKLNIYFTKTLVNCYKNNWTGVASTAWENPLNWSCNKIPDSNTDVTIGMGTCIVNSIAICRTLAVSSNAKLTVNPAFSMNVLK